MQVPIVDMTVYHRCFGTNIITCSMSYTIAGVNFGDKPVWNALFQGFKKSVQQNTSAQLVAKQIDAPIYRGGRSTVLKSNNYKLKHWREIVNGTAGNIVLADTDTVFLQDVGDVFNHSFDIGITVFPDPNWWLNGGIVFVRNSKKAKQFFDDWCEYDQQVYDQNPMGVRFPNDLGVPGQNQYALALMIRDGYDIDIKRFPCHIYNCCNKEWANFSDNTRVVHIKSSLRNYLFMRGRPQMDTFPMIADAVRGYYDFPRNR